MSVYRFRFKICLGPGLQITNLNFKLIPNEAQNKNMSTNTHADLLWFFGTSFYCVTLLNNETVFRCKMENSVFVTSSTWEFNWFQHICVAIAVTNSMSFTLFKLIWKFPLSIISIKTNSTNYFKYVREILK